MKSVDNKFFCGTLLPEHHPAPENALTTCHLITKSSKVFVVCVKFSRCADRWIENIQEVVNPWFACCTNMWSQRNQSIVSLSLSATLCRRCHLPDNEIPFFLLLVFKSTESTVESTELLAETSIFCSCKLDDESSFRAINGDKLFNTILDWGVIFNFLCALLFQSLTVSVVTKEF